MREFGISRSQCSGLPAELFSDICCPNSALRSTAGRSLAHSLRNGKAGGASLSARPPAARAVSAALGQSDYADPRSSAGGRRPWLEVDLAIQLLEPTEVHIQLLAFWRRSMRSARHPLRPSWIPRRRSFASGRATIPSASLITVAGAEQPARHNRGAAGSQMPLMDEAERRGFERQVAGGRCICFAACFGGAFWRRYDLLGRKSIWRLSSPPPRLR